MNAKRGRARFSDGVAGGRRSAVLRAIAAARGLTTAERCVLAMVEAHVGYAERETGWCWPAMATIGAAAGLSERQAFRVVASLRTKHWLEVEPKIVRGEQVTSWYRVTPDRAAALATEAP